MRGLAGIASLDGKQSPPRAVVSRMLSVLGPADAGSVFFSRPGILLAQRSSSLPKTEPDVESPAATSVLCSSDGRVSLGRKQAGAQSMQDSLESSGLEALRTVRGPLALAWWNGPARTLMLVRDGVGGSSLFYARAGNYLIFASELRAMLASGLIDYEPDLQSMSDYLGLGYVPAPMTAAKGVRKLAPGTYLKLSNAKFEVHEWDKLGIASTHADEAGSVGATHNCLSEHLHDAVVSPEQGEQSLLLTHPLHGGAIASLCGRTQPMRVYSLAFGNTKNAAGPWLQSLRGVTHTSVTLDPVTFRQLLPMAWGSLDEPICDLSAPGMAYLAAAAAANTKAVISDEGGAAVFGDAGTLHAALLLKLLEGYQKTIPRGLRDAAIAIAGGRPKHWLSMASKPIDRVPALLGLHSSNRHVLSDALLHEPHEFEGGFRSSQRHIETAYAQAAHADALSQLLHVNLAWLTEAVAAKTGRLCSAHGLSVRLPYLDRNLIAALFKLRRTAKQASPFLAMPQAFRKTFGARPPWPAVLRFAHEGMRPPVAWLDKQGDWLRQRLLDHSGSEGLFRQRSLERLLSLPVSVYRQTAWSLVILNLWDEQMRAITRRAPSLREAI
jgi:asparagine synthase (glutamine-hydrolysing)